MTAASAVSSGIPALADTARCAVNTPAITTNPPMTCGTVSASPSSAQAESEATTTSAYPMPPATGAVMKRSPLRPRPYASAVQPMSRSTLTSPVVSTPPSATSDDSVAQSSAHGAAKGAKATAPTAKPTASSTRTSTFAVSRSPERKYVAWQAAAAEPATRPTASSRRPDQTSTTMHRPAILSSVPITAARGSTVRRTKRTQATTTMGPMNSSRSAMPTGRRSTAMK